MIEFSIDLYKTGKYRVVTRHGRNVRIVCTDYNDGRYGSSFNIVGIVNLGNTEELGTFRKNGRSNSYDNDISGNDLFLTKITFKEGDIVSYQDFNSRHIGILHSIEAIDGGLHYDYVTLCSNGALRFSRILEDNDRMDYASEKDRNRLFDALAKAGKRWNSDEMCIEDIPLQCKLAPFQEVLVRNADSQLWANNIFGFYKQGDPFPYYCGNSRFKQCIPFKGNEKLLGTNKNTNE